MLLQILIAADQMLNAMIPGGWPDETISSRAFRESHSSPAWARARRVIDWVALHVFRDPDHCHEAYLNEIRRAQEPPAIRAIVLPKNN